MVGLVEAKIFGGSSAFIVLFRYIYRGAIDSPTMIRCAFVWQLSLLFSFIIPMDAMFKYMYS